MRRIVKLVGLVTTIALLGAGTGSWSGVNAAEFDPEGKYKTIRPARLLEESEDRDKVEIVDVFWYGCPHCYEFFPLLNAWEESKPDYVVVRRAPAVFRSSWGPHARAYYTALLLGVADRMHPLIFEAMHAQHRTLNTKEQLMEFFAEHGVDKEEFKRTYDSFTVDSMTRESEVMSRRWGVQGTPSVIVNGRYLVSGSTAGGHAQAIKVIEALVQREHDAIMQRAQQGS